MAKVLRRNDGGWFSSRDMGPDFVYTLECATEPEIKNLVGKKVTCDTQHCKAKLELEPNDRVYYENQSGCPYPAYVYATMRFWHIRCPNCYRFVRIFQETNNGKLSLAK